VVLKSKVMALWLLCFVPVVKAAYHQVRPGLRCLDRRGARGDPMASRDPGCGQAQQALNLNPKVVLSVLWPYSPAQLEPFFQLS